MKPYHLTCFFLLLASPLLCAESPAPKWSLDRAFRLLVRIEPPANARNGDECPAELVLDFPELLPKSATGRLPDLTTLQIVAYDAATGDPVKSTPWAHGQGPCDVPWRWYDSSIGYDFQEFRGNVDATEGVLRYEALPRLGYFYDCVGDGRKGRLCFMCRVTAGSPANYTVYFDLLPADAHRTKQEPRGFIGDGLNRCAPVGDSTTGLIHSRVDAADWDGDGLPDLIVGCARGGVLCYRNEGTPAEPRYPCARLLFTQDGKPLDVGWSSAPKVVDWDGNGLPDLLCGAEWNRVLYYRNTGKPGAPALEYAGFVTTDDGQPLRIPWEPSPETQPHFTYTRDYYPVLEVVDWDGDGDSDLLAGGYVTGRIFLFENTAGPGKAPLLHSVGPLEADGKPIDVAWAAAPTVADLDGDGDLDMVSGCMPMTAGGGDSSSSEHFLYFYRNVGTRKNPGFHEERLPRKGSFPSACLGTPRLVDWNGDGLRDLVVSAGPQIYLYRNVGTPADPCFEADAPPLPSAWGGASVAATQFLDWNGDGKVDAVNAPWVALNTGQGNPGVFASPFSVLREGQTISHLSGIGDDWRCPRLYDLDGDGRVDYMDADHAGHFWWHRNSGTRDNPEMDTQGILLALADGQPVSVGEGMEGFDALQGARANYTVGDVDGDGRPDMVAVNAKGVVSWFRQAPPEKIGAPPKFEPGRQVGQLRTRGAASLADWNNDGRLDIVAASSSEDATVFLGRESKADSPFEPARRIQLPTAPFGAGQPVVVADYNGDGDQDIILYTSYGYMCFYERSFIERGYDRGTVMAVEKRP